MDATSAHASIQATDSSCQPLPSPRDQQPGAGAAAASSVQAVTSSHSSTGHTTAAIPVQVKSRTGRWIRITVAAIKAILFLELASMVARPLIASRAKQSSNQEDATDSDLDPADVLMDYLTGRTGLAALQLLRTDQLSAAVDNLITEDYKELGVQDRGAEIRRIIDDIIQAREKGLDTPSSRAGKQTRVGLGGVGSLRFSNTKQSFAKELSPPATAEAAAAAPSADGGSSGGNAQ